MAKRKRKNKIILPLVLVCILCALVVGLFLLKKSNADATAQETGESEATVTAFSRSGVIVTSMTFEGTEETLTFNYENESWRYAGDANFPVDTDAVDLLAENLMKVEAQMKVDTDGAETEGFGLGEEAETVSATYSDGRTVEFRFGVVNSYNNYQYFTYTDSTGVYLVSQTVLSAFDVELNDLYKSESCTLVTDGAEEDNVTSVLITSAKGQQNGITDETACKDLFSVMSYFNLSVWEDYYADETEMKETYGISKEGDRATVSYTLTNYKEDENGEYVPVEVQKTYTVYFGNEFQQVEDTTEAEDGSDNWRAFYTVEGSNRVYSVGSEHVDKLFNYLAYTPDAETEKEEATIE